MPMEIRLASLILCPLIRALHASAAIADTTVQSWPRRICRRSRWLPLADAHAAFDRFVSVYAAKYPKATETLKKDRGSLLAFYEFPAEHWQHLRTTDAIESTFATVRHPTTRTRDCVSRTDLGLAFKVIEECRENLVPHQRSPTDQAVVGGHPFQG
jgi:hypothetical protein